MKCGDFKGQNEMRAADRKQTVFFFFFFFFFFSPTAVDHLGKFEDVIFCNITSVKGLQ